jgi:hypothetical protein
MFVFEVVVLILEGLAALFRLLRSIKDIRQPRRGRPRPRRRQAKGDAVKRE